MKIMPLFSLLVVMGVSCGRAPDTFVITAMPSDNDFAEINNQLDDSPDLAGPRYVCIYISRADATLAYRMNDRTMDKDQFERALNKLAEIDHGQTIAIEFGEGTDETDLDSTPSIKQFCIIGRNGRDRDSLRIIK